MTAASLPCRHVVLAVTEGDPPAAEPWDDVMVSLCAARRDHCDVSSADAVASGEENREGERGKEGRHAGRVDGTGEVQAVSNPTGGDEPAGWRQGPPVPSCCQAM